MGCSDAKCSDCGISSQYCTTCIQGFASNNGVCEKCAAFCSSCSVAGSGSCDDLSCVQGYVKLADSITCTSCLNGCSKCSPDDITVCLSCSSNKYMDSNGNCRACGVNCALCASPSCSACMSGYELVDGTCRAFLPFPCFVSSRGACSQCFSGY